MPFCNDYGDAAGCLGQADPAFTMDFTDVQKGAYIYWCSACGPKAKKLAAAVNKAFDEHGQEFTNKLKELVDEAHEGMVMQ